MTKPIITKSNSLIEASYSFSLNEHRILLYGVSLINPIQKDFPNNFIIDIKRFAEIFGINVDGLYTDIKKAIINKFFNRRFTVILENGEKELCHWLEKLTYEDGNGLLKLSFSSSSIPLLQNLKMKYTSYFIDQIANFKSMYSIRIYEFAIMEINKNNNNKHDFIINLNDLKERLAISDKYPRYFNFKKDILHKAQAEINTYSDLTIEYEEIKKGRAVESIKFIVKRKDGCQRAKYKSSQEVEPTNNQLMGEKTQPTLPTAEEIAAHMILDDLKDRLIRFGVAERVAYRLTENYSVERIENALKLIEKDYDKKNINNPAAFLVSAIQEEYTS